MPQNQRSIAGLILLLTGYTQLAASAAPAAYALSLTVLTPMQLIFISTATAGLFLAGTMAATGGLSTLFSLTARQFAWAVLSGLVLFVVWSVLFAAYASLPAQIVLTVIFCWTLLPVLLFRALHSMRPSVREVVCMLAGFGGAVIVLAGAGSRFGPLSTTGLVCVIAGIALAALHRLVSTMALQSLGGGRSLAGRTLGTLVSCLAAGLVLLVQGEMTSLPSEGLLYGICVGLFVFGIPWLGREVILRVFPDAPGSFTAFLIPFLSLFLVSLFLDESIAWTTLAGLAVIAMSAYLQRVSAEE